MWIKRADYLDLERRAAASAATVDWMRVRINQLERENAMLKGKVLGIPVEAPEIRVTTAPRTDAPTPAAAPLREAPSVQDIFAGNVGFEDMGEDEAQRQGVGWDPYTGAVTYN